MIQKEIFALALNITAPWFIESVDFDLSSGRLSIFVDFKKGSVFSVSNTEGEVWEGSAHDTINKTWRHLNFFQHECYITARIPRVKNGSGQISRVSPPWEGKMNGFTLLFEALLLQLISVMPVLKVQKL